MGLLKYGGASGGNGVSDIRCLVEEMSGVSWGGDWKVIHASDAVSGGICIIVWGMQRSGAAIRR